MVYTPRSKMLASGPDDDNTERAQSEFRDALAQFEVSTTTLLGKIKEDEKSATKVGNMQTTLKVVVAVKEELLKGEEKKEESPSKMTPPIK